MALRWLPLLIVAASAQAADVRVLAAGAVKSALVDAAAPWEGRTAHRMDASYGPAGEIRKRLGAGETTDVLIVPSENLAEYEKAGLIDIATRTDLGVAAIGVAVRKGAPTPDISTPEALRRTLIDTRSLTYMDPARGTTGKHFDESVLPRLGIRDAVRAKTTFGEGGFIAEKVARGEVEMAFHTITEILPVEGVTFVGPLPRELQKETVYSAVLMKGTANREAARSLLEVLASPAGRQAFLARGFALP